MADNVESLPDSLIDALSILSHELNRRSIRYALIGGIAAGVRGRPRFTDDIDLLLTVPQLQLPGLLESLLARGFSFDLLETIREFTQHHLVVMHFADVRVDWMKPPIPAYQHVLESATAEQWRGHELRIATAEGLILLKLVAGRTQDWADIESLLVANQGRLDIAWIEKEWCILADTQDPRWQRFVDVMHEFYERRSP
jgi:predicted nucleotidyltransferase